MTPFYRGGNDAKSLFQSLTISQWQNHNSNRGWPSCQALTMAHGATTPCLEDAFVGNRKKAPLS